MRARRLAAIAASAVGAAALLAGCGGGGGDSADASTPVATPTLPTAAGATAAEGAGEALAALGGVGAVDPVDVESTLGSYESFGLPHDLFLPQVVPAAEPEPEEAAADAAPTAPTALAAAPVVPIVPGAATVPLNGGVVVPTAPSTTPITPSITTPGAPSGSGDQGGPQNLTAYFTVRDAPVTAQQGDTIPPDRQELVVSAITENGVTLTLVRGLLPNGSDTLALRIGETAKLIDTQNGQGYTIKLADVREAQTP